MRFLRWTLAFAALASVAAAQSFTPIRELKNLSPAAVERLHTLETLNALPGGDWRFHIGDLAHGETPALDDSAWTVVPTPAPRKSFKAPKDAVWFRRTVEIPKTYNGYDLTGSRIWFQFEVDANGPMPEIIYFNGRRVALGDDLEPIVLFDHAQPGEKVLIAVKLLQTVDDKTFRAAHFRIEPDADSKRPNPDDIRTQIITASNLLPALPTPRRDLLPRVEAAAAAIDLTALAAADQPSFDASLQRAQAIISELRPALQTATIDLAGNSHIDAAWLWPRSETIDVVHRTFTSALQLMNEYPNYTFTQSAAQYSAWMADKYPELNAQIAQRVKEGRWEIVGGMWVEPDLNLPGGESLVRQLLVGQRMFHSLYGVTARIGWNPDSFGYNWQLPQIYKRSGMDYFVTQKMHWNDSNQLPFRLFWWQSPDGSKVLTYFPTDYAWTNLNPTRLSADFAESAARNPGTQEHFDLFGVGDHGGGPTRDMLDQGLHWMAPEPKPDTVILSEGRSPKSKDLHATSSPKATLPVSGNSFAMPNIRFHTAQQFFDDVQPKLSTHSPVWNYDLLAKGWAAPQSDGPGKVGIPTWNDELYFEYHRGVYTSQAKHKQNMRRSEAYTLDAEKLDSFAWLNGALRYHSTELNENWKKITFNQFHDLAAGSGIATIYRDAQKDYDEVFNTDYYITQVSRETIFSRIYTAFPADPIAQAVVVYNPLGWPTTQSVQLPVQLADVTRSAHVMDSDGRELPSEKSASDDKTHIFYLRTDVENVPAMGYKVLHVLPGPPQSTEPRVTLTQDSEAYTLANAKLRVVISKRNGCVTELSLKEGTSFLAPGACGNQLQTFADNPKNYDAWNIDPGTLDQPPTLLEKLDSADVWRVDETLRKTVHLQRSFGKSRITQDISLDVDGDSVVFDTWVYWHEKHTLLKAAFPLAATSPKATYEIPFGSIERPTTRDNTFSKAQFEVPALRWADLGDDKQGVSILNESKYGYDALGNTLRITLLRSPTWPDPDADQGIQHFRYAIYPHVGKWQRAETIHRAYELNQPLVAQQTFSHTGTLPATYSFASVENSNVILTAVKKAEDADALIFRMYEATGQGGDVKLHVPPGASFAVETNLMEKPEATHLPLANDIVTVPIKPFEILTVEVAYPHAGPK